MGEKPSGNARAINYRHPPIVRMTNTYIEPKSTSFGDMIADIREGVYAQELARRHNEYGDVHFFRRRSLHDPQRRIAEPMRPVVLSGNVFSTLKNIDAIGNDLDMNQGWRVRQGGTIAFACEQRQPAHTNQELPGGRKIEPGLPGSASRDPRPPLLPVASPRQGDPMEEVLSLARKVAEEAEIFAVTSENTPIQFETNRLKHAQTHQSTMFALRVVRHGRMATPPPPGWTMCRASSTWPWRRPNSA